jgi:four helix bundle protein
LENSASIDIGRIQSYQNFPKSEQFGLTSQVRRSVASVPTTTLKAKRDTKKEFIQYISKELEETNYHLFLSKELGYISEDEYKMLSAYKQRKNDVV